MKKSWILLGCMLSLGVISVHAEEIGSVDTVFKLLGPDHKIVVEAFDDPDVKNVTCYISRAKTGGIKGGLGLAEDTSDAAISCQQVGPIELTDKIKNKKSDGAVVFQKRTSLVFKKLQVVRFYDQKRNALIYLTYSDRVVDGFTQKCHQCSADYALVTGLILPCADIRYKKASVKLAF